MTTLHGVQCVVPAEPTATSVSEWRADLVRRLAQGARVVTLFGRPAEPGVLLTAVVQSAEGALEATRTAAEPKLHLPNLTEAHPAVHVFERELHEQLGVSFDGHPWSKPLRFESPGETDLGRYPFYQIQGKELHEVQVGPVHAGIIEPGAFRFACHGEDVLHLEIHLGYQHRGVEKLALAGPGAALAPLIETVAGDTSIGHTWAYAAAIEALASSTPSEVRDVSRAVLLELERAAMHLASLAGLATDLGFLQGASTYGRLRTTAINTTQQLCGSRFGRAAIRPAGSGARLDGPLLAEVRRATRLLRSDAAQIGERFLASRSVRHRLAGTGRVSGRTALGLGLVGLAARASGVPIDQRAFQGSLYEEHVVRTLSGGDCLARAELRIAELGDSLDRIERLVDRAPAWQPHRDPVGPLAPNVLAVSVVEGWRGEVVHCLETGADGALVHYKVQDPSMRNWMGLALAVRGNAISDFPICNKSFDLSYCGSDL